MSIDVNTLTAELSNLLDGIYTLQKYLYDLYLDDTPKDVSIQYKSLSGYDKTINVENLAKIKVKFNDLENTILSKAAFINLLKDVGFNDFNTYWSINSTLTYSVSIQPLTTSDKLAISAIIGEDIFVPPHNVSVTNKVLIQISNPANNTDLIFQQSASVIGLEAYHPKSFKMYALINPNGTGWTNNIEDYANPNPSVSYPYQLLLGHLSQIEIYYPALVPVYNRGLIPSLS